MKNRKKIYKKRSKNLIDDCQVPLDDTITKKPVKTAKNPQKTLKNHYKNRQKTRQKTKK
jgi:hypothetical protein